MDATSLNTDREIWRQTPGDYYSPSIHVTKDGGIAFNVGGTVAVRSARDWHSMALHPECLSRWFYAEDEEHATAIIADCPREILQIVAVLTSLDESTRDHAADLSADGWIFKPEEATNRANKYRDSINALVDIWGKPDEDE